MPCPNKNLNSWKNLVSALGNEVDALTVFNINDFEIPSIEDGKTLLEVFKSGKTTVSSEIREKVKEVKLARANEQIETLNRIIKSSPKDGRQSVLSMLKQNLESYKQAIENDEATVSVSNIMSGGEIEDTEKYKNYSEFGIFIHHVIETLQKETIGGGKSIVGLFSKEKLTSIFNAYDKKFEIKKLIENGEIVNLDELFNMTNDILSTVQHYISLGHTVLPEISIMVKDRFGRNIVGRLDILTIDKKGVVNIIDTKTKKINSGVSTDSLSHYWPVNGSENTDSKFMQTGNRNTYDNWDLQLGIYERMLNNLGIETNQKVILKLIYAGDYMNPENKYKQFDILGNDTFEYSYYKNEVYISSESSKVNQTELFRYKNFIKIIKEVFPNDSAQESESTSTIGDKAKFIFDISEEDAVSILEKLKKTTEDQIYSISKKLAEAVKLDSDKNLIKYYEERLQNLNKILDSFNQNQEAAIKLGGVLKNLQIDMQNLANRVVDIKTTVSDELLTERAKDLEHLNNISIAYDEFLLNLKNKLLDAGMKQNDRALEILGDIQRNIDNIRSVYNRLGFRFSLEFLKDAITQEQSEKMIEQRKEALLPQIEVLKRQREKLASGEKSTGYWYRISKLKFFNGNLSPENEIERLDFEIEKLEIKMRGIDFTDKGLEEYISAVLDPKSQLYIGEGTSWFTSVVASSSSSDLMLSAYANHLKHAMFDGSKKHVNFIESEKIQDEFDEFKQGEKDIAVLNERISEVRVESKFDEDGTENKVETRSFANPLSSEFYNVYESHYNKLRQLNKKIKETNDPDLLKDLKKQKADQIQSHLEWEMENVNMKYKREIYELDRLLPAEYKLRRDELNEEKNLLIQSAGFNNMERLDEEVKDRIAEIEVELNKLRMEYANKEEGGYEKYLQLMDQYYEYTVNQGYYDRLLQQKISEYTDQNNNVNVEAIEKWKSENTIKRPIEDWYNAISDIWDNIFIIIGKSNPRIEKLQEKYRDILTQYRRKGVIDSRFLTDEDIKSLEEIEELIALYKLSSGKSDLSYDDRNALTELFQDLSALQTKVENPYYLKEFNVRLQSLDNKWNLYKKQIGKEDEQTTLEQFILEEQEFKSWYDKNHTNSYESRLISNQGLNPLPKKFNMITVPTDDNMFEIVPDYKFTTSKLVEDAINPNYREDVNGYPMPLGLVRDGARVDGESRWLNPKYKQIRNNPRDFKFYNSFVGRFLKMQEEITGQTLGYNFPGYTRESLDQYNENGVLGGLKNRLKLFKDKNLVVGSTYDYTLNNYRTNVEDRIQIKHNSTLPLDQQSRDGIGSVLRWFENAHMNVSLAEIQPMAKSVISFMESQYESLARSQFAGKEKNMEKLRTVIDQMKFEYDKFIKGEWKKDEGMIGRYADLLLRGIGFTRLAFDLPNQIGNLLAGNVQSYLGSHSSGIYSFKNYTWAKNKIYSFQDGLIGSLLADQGKFGNRSFITNMFLYWNPQEKQLEDYYDRTRTTDQRLKQGALDLNASFYIQDKGELEIASTIWLSIMDATKVKLVASRDENGKPLEYVKDSEGNIKTVNAFDAYTQNSKGEIVIRDDVDWTKKNEKALQNTVWAEIMRTQGNYAEANRTKMESGFKGRLLFYYRKYLVPSVRNRFGRMEDQWSSGTISYGYWRALLKSFKVNGFFNTLGSIVGQNEESTGVNDYYKMKSQMAAKEFLVVALMYIIGLAIKGAVGDDDEDKEKNKVGRTVLFNLINVYAKVQRETSSLTPIPLMGGVRSYIETFGEFTNANRDVGRVIRTLEHGIFLVGAQAFESDYWQKKAYYQKKYGPFEKGEAKIKKDILDLTGWMNIFELSNPEIRAKLWTRTL